MVAHATLMCYSDRMDLTAQGHTVEDRVDPIDTDERSINDYLGSQRTMPAMKKPPIMSVPPAPLTVSILPWSLRITSRCRPEDHHHLVVDCMCPIRLNHTLAWCRNRYGNDDGPAIDHRWHSAVDYLIVVPTPEDAVELMLVGPWDDPDGTAT